MNLSKGMLAVPVLALPIELVFLVDRVAGQFIFLQELPGASINLRRFFIVPVRVTFYFRELRVEALGVQRSARGPDHRQWEETVIGSHENRYRNLALGSLNEVTVLAAVQGSGMDRRGGEILRLEQRKVKGLSGSRRVPEQINSARVNRIPGFKRFNEFVNSIGPVRGYVPSL